MTIKYNMFFFFQRVIRWVRMMLVRVREVSSIQVGIYRRLVSTGEPSWQPILNSELKPRPLFRACITHISRCRSTRWRKCREFFFSFFYLYIYPAFFLPLHCTVCVCFSYKLYFYFLYFSFLFLWEVRTLDLYIKLVSIR